IPARYDYISAQIATPIPTFHCPTRRSAIVYPYDAQTLHNANKALIIKSGAARTDYAASSGGMRPWAPNGPVSYAQGAEWDMKGTWKTQEIPQNGIAYQRSKVRFGQITDGTSNTYCVGERHIDPQQYKTGLAADDDQFWSVGHDLDTTRYSYFGTDVVDTTNIGAYQSAAPRQDTRGFGGYNNWGSAHAASWNIAFCDGSVHAISYSIDGETHRRLGARNDGLPVSDF
ncbi:MAG: DUF1559 domain-containing protein, partial [Planctomycetales bacterium]|nr:DUF1559 domain-containing protein [Planctomycetales bacterium]